MDFAALTVGAVETDFIEYLLLLMVESGKFTPVRPQTSGRADHNFMADILARKTHSKTSSLVVIECKVQAYLSKERVEAALRTLLKIREKELGAKLVLALPGRIAQDGHAFLKQHAVELWDIDYIARNFSKEIRNHPHPIFQRLFQSRPTQSPHEQLLENFNDCPKGRADWALYQQLCGRLLELCYCPPLSAPIGEHTDFSRANRRDFILPNPTESGFWKYIQIRYLADYIVIDAKNSGKRITKKDVLQIANYLKPQGTGMFALIFCRIGADSGALHTLREQWLLHQKMIIVLDDHSVEGILTDAGAGGNGTQTIEDLIQKFRLSI